MRRALLSHLVLFALGCVSFEPRPLDPESEWRRLEGLRLDDLAPPRNNARSSESGRPPAFDYTNGLSADEAAGLAVAFNPTLRASRLRQGIAEGQLLGAGLLPNPTIDTKWLVPTNAASWKGEVNSAINLTQILLRRSLERERAQIGIEEVRWDVAEEEWALAAQAREAWIELVYSEEALALFAATRNARERLTAAVREQQRAGDTGTLELLLAEADLANLTRLEPRLQGGRQRALQALNALLGLPPDHPTRIEKPENPLAFAPATVDRSAALEKLWERRPDLLAAERAYAGAEKDLQLACRKQFPSFTVGPSWERDGTANYLGFNAAIELPIFNRNQGDIAAKTAVRDQRRREFEAALQAARTDFEDARASFDALEGELKVIFAELVPRLERSVDLTQRALQAGSVSQSEVLKLQLRLLETRSEVLKTLRDYHRARISVDRAQGPRIDPRAPLSKPGSAP